MDNTPLTLLIGAIFTGFSGLVISIVNAIIGAKKTQVEELKVQVADLKEENKKLKQENEELRGRVNALEQKDDSNRITICKLEEDLIHERATVRDLTEKLNVALEENQKLLKEKKELLDKIKELSERTENE